MKGMTFLFAAAAAAAASVPAAAHRPAGGLAENEFNPWWRDYQVDLSEARRELRKDLADAKNAADRGNAYAEYDREVADARRDYLKEMRERGLRAGTVRVEDDGR